MNEGREDGYMYNEEYVFYLNTLHNYNAQNSNSYGEKNVNNDFFQDVMVEVSLSEFIRKRIEGDVPHVIILTGHAGDGKTSIMYQVLKNLGISFDPEIKICDYALPSKRTCRCVKDFSEIPDEKKKLVLQEAVTMPENGDFVFMVANTGPLINTFGKLFEEKKTSEKAKLKLIDAMDRNTGNIEEIEGYKICVINVASVDNTYFAEKFLEKLTQEKLWLNCAGCPKNIYCHILKNRDLIVKNKKCVNDFINMHYIWLAEYGKRLTIRSITEQLAYMLTGGFQCSEIVKADSYKYLFSNLFFGYIGTVADPKAKNILAIREIQNCGYDKKRLRADEKLFVNREYHKLFGKEVAEIILAASEKYENVSGWNEFLRRTYFFTNIETEEQIIEENCEDVFSKQYRKFLALRNRETTPAKSDSNLVCDALAMIYVGTTNYGQMIPLTLSRESGIAQNVQLITGRLVDKWVKIIQRPAKDKVFDDKVQRQSLSLQVNGQELKCELTLPLINYFEELKNGIISTNVDPQLSYGIESLKAELSELVDDPEDETFEMVILKNKGPKFVGLEITKNQKIRET